MNISYQLELKPELSTVYGPKDYTEFREQLQQIDSLLTQSYAENRFISNFIEKNEKYIKKIPFLRKALRSLILLNLTNESFRNLAFRLADSDLFRWFIGADTLKGATTPSKSNIQRFEHLWSKEEITEFIHDLNTQVSSSYNSEVLIHSDTPIEISDIYADSTCIKANIHHPVDWLLFRDSVRTLIKSINLIRTHGLFHRMEDPNKFLSEMNNLSIEMTQTSRDRNGKKKRKKVFRKMKKLLKKVEKHGKTYCSLLNVNWEITDLSKKQADQIMKRMSNIIEQIPSIIKLAHKRIISGKKVDNAEKILSLYEKNVHIIKRGKMEADVEFGNVFFLAEQKDGVIVDWDFMEDKPKPDTVLLKESVERIIDKYNEIDLFSTDRGFNCKRNDKYLKKKKIFNATCSRNPTELVIKMKDDKYRNAQKRRAQTEGRIGIFKNKFIGKKILRKGSKNCEDKILWSILTHNLWVIARKAIDNIKQRELEFSQVA